MIRLFTRLFVAVFLTVIFPLSYTVFAEDLEEKTNPFPLFDLPHEVRLKIFNSLDFKSVLHLSMASKACNEDVKNEFIKESSFLNRYPGHKKQWDLIAKRLKDEQIKEWVQQFSDDSNISDFLCANKTHYQFSAILFYRISYLMNSAQQFEVQEERCIPYNDSVRSVTLGPEGLLIVTTNSGKINTAILSSDRRHLVIASNLDNKVNIWEKNSDDIWEKKACFDNNGTVRSATFSSDGLHLVTASDDKTAKIWGPNGISRWSEKACIDHEDEVELASFSSDGRHVVTVTNYKTVKIWMLRMKRDSAPPR